MTRRLSISLLTGIAVLALLGLNPRAARADNITFAVGDYDNTANTVTAGPVFGYNQTTGKFRDVFWWRDNAQGPPLLPTADYINSGKNLVLCGIAACDNGTGAQTALNFTGPSTSGGQSYLTLYDTTPADGVTNKNNFDVFVPGGLTISADVLFASNAHATSGGVTAMYNEGQDALALLAGNAGGSGDPQRLSLIFQSKFNGITLANTNLNGATLTAGNWYRVTLNVVASGGGVTAIGTVQSHVTGSNPNSGLNAVPLATLNYSGTLADPDAAASSHNTLVLTNPGEVGLMAMAREGITDFGCAPKSAGGSYDNAFAVNNSTNKCTDNVGVSITNFDLPGDSVPEPGSMLLLGSGLLGLARIYQRRKR